MLGEVFKGSPKNDGSGALDQPRQPSKWLTQLAYGASAHTRCRCQTARRTIGAFANFDICIHSHQLLCRLITIADGKFEIGRYF